MIKTLLINKVFIISINPSQFQNQDGILLRGYGINGLLKLLTQANISIEISSKLNLKVIIQRNLDIKKPDEKFHRVLIFYIIYQ